FQTGFLAITASVLGGLGSLRGAVIGSFAVGLVGALSTAYVGERWANAFVFTVLLIVLVFRPEGLLGQRAREVS
ncbi:MAG: branched-chain amino acid ABC transporter permease, partial [Pirellulales bacterium]|nr:branched-chain amino acid ABC transporter permease [Pirellulales bacterium]